MSREESRKLILKAIAKEWVDAHSEEALQDILATYRYEELDAKIKALTAECLPRRPYSKEEFRIFCERLEEL